MSKRFSAALLAALILISAAACGKNTGETGYPVILGETEIKETPRRVITLSSALYESVVVLGFRARIVGVGSFSDGPGSVDSLPRCGTSLDPDVDKMLSLSPDLVLTSAALPSSAEERLRAAEVNVITLESASSLEGYNDNLSLLGSLFAGNDMGALISEDISYYTDVTLEYLAGHIPEGTGMAVIMRLPNNAATPDTWVNDLIEGAGMINTADGQSWYYSPAEGESAKADVIFCDESISSSSLGQSIWKNTSAYLNGRVVYFDSSSLETQSPAAVSAFEKAVIEAFPDIEWGEKPSVTVVREEAEDEPTAFEKIKAKLGLG